MNGYDLIFSNNRRYRYRRHLLFWVAWCIYLSVTYLIPTNWIPGWNLNAPMPHIERYGVVLAVLRILLAAVLLTLVHMLLVYGILYFILPRYFSKNRNRLVTTGLLLLHVCTVAIINYFNFILAMYMSTRVGYFDKMPGMMFILPLWSRQVLFNYPTVVGFALTIKLLKNLYLRQKETEHLALEKFKAELQILKAQVHPHFLFNTLNNVYSLILNGSSAAPETVKTLSGLLRYFVYECDQPLVPLEKELKMIRDYISLEKIRYGDNLNMSVQVRGNAVHKMISPLLLIPFLENSFKHGASRMLTHPWVNLDIELQEQTLLFKLSNSKPGSYSENMATQGIGLSNVQKRLALLYPVTHSLKIYEDDMSFNVCLTLRLHKSGETTTPNKVTSTEKPVYDPV
jgi:hypothetical protein